MAMLIAAPAMSRPVPTYSLESISQVPTAQLARQLLGPEAADVESHEVIDGGLVQFLAGVRFYHRPRSTAADICSRRVQYVGFASQGPAAPDSAPRDRLAAPGAVHESLQIALAPDCRLVPGQHFAYFDPALGQEVASDALRTVPAVSAATRAGDSLPFSFTCRDELGQGACGEDGRGVLAGMRVEQVWLIQTDPNSAEHVRVLVGDEPGQVFWELRFAVGTATPADLVMTRKIPAPF